MQATRTILVTGSNGQLGSELREIAPQYPDFRCIFLSRAEASVNEQEAMKALFEKHQPQYLINCAAYTAVDKAEKEKDLAFDINGNAVGALAKLCKEFNTRFIHISTDYVFDGTIRSPLKETEKVQPVNQYGASKLLGEQLAMQNNPDAIIIRTSWVYSFYGNNFVKTMIRLMNERETISVVSDQVGSPTYAADLAEVIMQIINSDKWSPGIYNYSNDGIITWFDFAIEIKNLISAECKVLPITTDQYPTPAKRPAYSVLDKTKILSTFNIQIIPWQKSLGICLSKLTGNKIA